MMMPEDPNPPGGQPDPAPNPADDPKGDPKPAQDGTDWKAEARKWEQRAKDNSDAAARLKEIEDAQKTEQEKLTQDLEKARADASTSSAAALRLEVALEKAPDGMEPAKIAKLAKRLTGSTREDLEKDAEELFAELAPAGKRPPGQRPTPDLQQVPLGGDAGDVKTDMDEWMRRKVVSE